MKHLRAIFNFYIHSSIHVALSVFSLSWITMVQFDLPIDRNLLYINFYATITGYNFVKYFGLAKFHHKSLTNWLRYIQVFSGIVFVALVYYFFKIDITIRFVLLAMAAVTFLYAIPIIPRAYFLDRKKNLRQISGLKIYVIAFVWTVVTVAIPLQNELYTFNDDIVIVMLQRFLFVIVLMLPFEIRDLNYDSLKLATIPQRIGVERTKIIGVFLLVVFFVMEFLKDELSGISILTTLLISVTALLFLIFTSKKQSKYYSAFWVEAIPIIWLAILLVFG